MTLREPHVWRHTSMLLPNFWQSKTTYPLQQQLVGRLVRGACQHNLCELYLALGTQLTADGKTSDAQNAFAQSINYGNKVIDGGTYSLMTSRFGSRKTESSISFNVYKNGVAGTPIDTIQAKTNLYWDLFQENNVNYQDGNKECYLGFADRLCRL